MALLLSKIGARLEGARVDPFQLAPDVLFQRKRGMICQDLGHPLTGQGEQSRLAIRQPPFVAVVDAQVGQVPFSGVKGIARGAFSQEVAAGAARLDRGLQPVRRGALDPAVQADAAAEDLYVDQVLEHTHGNKVRAARILGINRRTLYRRGYRPAERGESDADVESEPDSKSTTGRSR
jgi:hypothetical protein